MSEDEGPTPENMIEALPYDDSADPWVHVYGRTAVQAENAKDWRAGWLLAKRTGLVEPLPWEPGSYARAAYMASLAYQKERGK